jgi:hypothetical protein
MEEFKISPLRNKNVGLGFLLPTISVLKSKLMSLKDEASISICQPSITGLLDAIHSRYFLYIVKQVNLFLTIPFLRINNMFSDNDLRLAAISNPMFRLSGLESDEERRRARILLEGEFGRLFIQSKHPIQSFPIILKEMKRKPKQLKKKFVKKT